MDAADELLARCKPVTVERDRVRDALLSWLRGAGDAGETSCGCRCATGRRRSTSTASTEGWSSVRSPARVSGPRSPLPEENDASWPRPGPSPASGAAGCPAPAHPAEHRDQQEDPAEQRGVSRRLGWAAARRLMHHEVRVGHRTEHNRAATRVQQADADQQAGTSSMSAAQSRARWGSRRCRRRRRPRRRGRTASGSVTGEQEGDHHTVAAMRRPGGVPPCGCSSTQAGWLSSMALSGRINGLGRSGRTRLRPASVRPVASGGSPSHPRLLPPTYRNMGTAAPREGPPLPGVSRAGGAVVHGQRARARAPRSAGSFQLNKRGRFTAVDGQQRDRWCTTSRRTPWRPSTRRPRSAEQPHPTSRRHQVDDARPHRARPRTPRRAWPSDATEGADRPWKPCRRTGTRRPRECGEDGRQAAGVDGVAGW